MNKQRLYIVGLFVTLLIVLGTLSYSTISIIERATKNISVIIDHPYSVSKAANEAIITLHHLTLDEQQFHQYDVETIYESIDHIEEHLPVLDSLVAIINERYLGPIADLNDLNKRTEQFKTDISNSCDELANAEFTNLNLYQEISNEIVALELVLIRINAFADSKRDAILSNSLEYKNTYLSRLQLYIALMIIIFASVIFLIAVNVRQKLVLIAENNKLSQSARKNTDRINRINKIFEYAATNEQEFLDYALDQAIALTESKVGYFYFYNNETKEFILNSWSKDVMEECSIANPKLRYSLQSTGIWGEAVRQKKAFIINDFEKHNPLKKGYPKGHVKLRNYMTAPIYENNRIAAVVGVANKETDFTEDDLTQMQLLMNQVWNINKARQKEIENDRFIRAVTDSPLSIVITDKNGSIEYVNEYFTKLTGYSQEEVIGNNPRILKSGAQDEKFYEHLWETITTGYTWKGEFQNVSKGGNIYWESATISPIKDDKDEITSYVAVKEDITIRKVMLQNISYNQRFKDSIFSAMKEGLIVQDKDYNTLVANESACQIFEMSMSEIKEVGPWDDHWKAISIDGKPISSEEFPVVKAINESKNVDNFIMNLVMGNEKRKFLSISSRPIFNDEGEVIQAVSTFKDITSLIESNQALISSEQKYRDLFELSADPSMVLNENFIVDVNDAAVDLFKYYDKDQLIGVELEALSPKIQPDGSFSKDHLPKITKLVERNGSHRFEFYHKKSNGIIFPADVMLTRITENGNSFTHVVMRDISEQKSQERIILDQLKEKDVLVAEIHHRVKNNMAVISGLIQLEMFKTENKDLIPVLDKTVNRIKSIATIHERVYNKPDFRKIDLASIINNLIKNHSVDYYTKHKRDINIQFNDHGNVEINVNQALPFGLIFDELLINYLTIIEKHELKENIQVDLYKEINDVHFVVSFSGENKIDIQYKDDFDRALIDVLVTQLDASIRFKSINILSTYMHFKVRESVATAGHQII